MADYPRLVADIGGSSTRFAICDENRQLHQLESQPTADYDNLEDAIQDYLDKVETPPRAACLAIAGPVGDDQVAMTNEDWRFSIASLQQRFGWQALRVINDFAAVALALPHLNPDQTVEIGGGKAQPGQPLCVLGPGTGLGVAQLVPSGRDWIPVPTEGGHVLLAAGNRIELEILDYWLNKGLFVSRENLLSGPGLVRLYQACCALGGHAERALEPPEVTGLALDHGDPAAEQALAVFFGLLGSCCGDQALATGARGGVYLAGGILPGLAAALADSSFRRRFEAKGPMSDYAKAIQTRLIVEPQPGLIGATYCAL